MTSPQRITTPIPGVLVGINHTATLQPIIREPRVLKVGIGIPKGKACYVYTFKGRWIVRYGAIKGDKLVMETALGSDKQKGFPARDEAQVWYEANKSTFAEAKYPQRLPFFTFTRRTVNENGEIFEPDFAAIEAHGDTPTVLDIVFMGENPLFQEFQAWSATELKCHGDGLNALRVISLGSPDWPGWNEANAAGQKYFPVLDDCFSQGFCPFAAEGGKDKLVCKPMSTLSFQLANSIRLGSTAYFTSTGIASAKSLFSSLEVIRSLAQRIGSGITNTPLKLVLRPFKTHGGVQQAASLELRTQDVKALRELLMASAWAPQPQRMLSAAEEDEPIAQSAAAVTAAAVTAEFYPEATSDPQYDMEDAPADPHPMADATDKKTDTLAEKLKAERGKPKAEAKPEAKTETGPPSEPKTAPPAPAPTSPKPNGPVNADGEPLVEVWRKRIVESFRASLGEGEFLAIIHSVTGSEALESITLDNYKRIWSLLEQAQNKDKAGLPSEPPSDPNDGVKGGVKGKAYF